MLRLAFSEARATAGAVVHGNVHAPDDVDVAVELVRVERSPAGFATYHVATAELGDDGSFELVVPDDTPPDVVGHECSLHYALRAISRDEEVREAFAVAP